MPMDSVTATRVMMAAGVGGLFTLFCLAVRVSEGQSNVNPRIIRNARECIARMDVTKTIREAGSRDPRDSRAVIGRKINRLDRVITALETLKDISGSPSVFNSMVQCDGEALIKDATALRATLKSVYTTMRSSATGGSL